jgi:hypothetical protein
MLGMLLTAAALAFTLQIPVLSLLLVPVWAAIVFGGTYVLPESITVPYDPTGHPALWLIGLVGNGAYLGALSFAIWALVRRLLERRAARV